MKILNSPPTERTDGPPSSPGTVVLDDASGDLWGLGTDHCWRCLDRSSDGWGADQLWPRGTGFTVVFDATPYQPRAITNTAPLPASELAQPEVIAGRAHVLDCEVCAGTGVMTARAAEQHGAVPALVQCPGCAGTGVRVIADGRGNVLVVQP